jgi:DNA-binding NtrC family response regulator
MKSAGVGLFSGDSIMLPVLLLETDLDLRGAIVEALQRAHVVCDTAASAAGAMLKIRESDYSYIVVDVDSDDDLRPLVDACVLDPKLLAKVVVISDGGDTPRVMSDQPQLVKPFDAQQLLAPLTD